MLKYLYHYRVFLTLLICLIYVKIKLQTSFKCMAKADVLKLVLT